MEGSRRQGRENPGLLPRESRKALLLTAPIFALPLQREDANDQAPTGRGQGLTLCRPDSAKPGSAH